MLEARRMVDLQLRNLGLTLENLLWSFIYTPDLFVIKFLEVETSSTTNSRESPRRVENGEPKE